MEVKFSLKYRLGPEVITYDEILEKIGAAGCTDALVGLDCLGNLGLDFIREANSTEDAILSAIADVKSALPTAKLIG